MRIGIVDADLLGRDKHRFPNLACEKISGYWKEKGAEVQLILDKEYNWAKYGYSILAEISINDFDTIYISKVFTDTPIPDEVISLSKQYPERVKLGGTGFYFDKAENLPDEIEHHMPDYHLYDEWIENDVERARLAAIRSNRIFNEATYRVQFKEYTEYSIGFLTRGCFRKCKFCVNQKYSHVFRHSQLAEFYDESRKKICLLDDNFFGCRYWKEMLEELISTGKPFKFKQGLDERLLDDDKCNLLFKANYDADLTFAFDNYSDYELIHEKLKLIQKYRSNTARNIKFYVLVGYESTDLQDIEHAFARIALLFRYHCLPYIMRYQNHNETPWQNSEYRGVYISLARWCNQPGFVKKMTFREFCHANQLQSKNRDKSCSTLRSMELIEEKCPDIAKKYFDIRFGYDSDEK